MTRATRIGIVPSVEIRPCSASETDEEPIHRASGAVKLLTVSDLHQSAELYTQLAQAIERHRPHVLALIGDFLDVPGIGAGMLGMRECAEAVARLPVPEIILVRGNHEDWNYLSFADAMSSAGRSLTTLHGEAHVHGPMTMIGFPTLLGDETAFTLHKRPLAPHPDGWLPKLIRKMGPAARALWLMHEPPAGTPLSVPSGPISGNQEWSDAIHRFSPWLVVCGHDHRTPVKSGKWYCRLGDTVAVNVGQPHDDRLHYCVIDAQFDSVQTSLPRRMVVHAYPSDQTVELPLL